MKRLLLLALAGILVNQALSQGCDEIFISEYIEGWSNNKAIELYNPTDVDVDLSEYRLERYSNGSNTAADNQKLDLGGTLESLGTWVIVIDKRDPDGVDQETPVWEELQEKADTFMCPVYDENNAMYFNGNDALVLRKIADNVVIDVFGRIGEDPGNPSDGGGWNNVGPDFSWALNGATAWSANHTLIRKDGVVMGDMNAIDVFDVGLEWDSLPANTFDNLGMHSCECGDANFVEESSTHELVVYPNPSKNHKFYVDSDEFINRIEVYKADGGLALFRKEYQATKVAEVNLQDSPSGTYILKAFFEDGTVGTSTLIAK